jgi:hypothetical protein
VGHFFNQYVLRNPTFNWHGVRLAVEYFTQMRFAKIILVVHPKMEKSLPVDLQQNVEIYKAAKVDNMKDSDDYETLLVASAYNCLFVENDQYRNWKERAPSLSKSVRDFFNNGHAKDLQIFYAFCDDEFVPLFPSNYQPKTSLLDETGFLGCEWIVIADSVRLREHPKLKSTSFTMDVFQGCLLKQNLEMLRGSYTIGVEFDGSSFFVDVLSKDGKEIFMKRKNLDDNS